MNPGFPKLKFHGTGTFSPPTPKELCHNSEIGDYVKFNTIEGTTYVGVLIEWDSNVAIVKSADGTTMPVEV